MMDLTTGKRFCNNGEVLKLYLQMIVKYDNVTLLILAGGAQNVLVVIKVIINKQQNFH